MCTYEITKINQIINEQSAYIYYCYFFSHGGSLLGTWAFSSCAEAGLLFVMVGRLLIVAAALIAEHRL